MSLAAVTCVGQASRLRQGGGLLLLLALALAAYQPVLSAGFIWDDDSYVTLNPLLKTVGGLRQIWLEPTASPQYYPLVFTTFWLEHHAWGLWPVGYHAVNLLVHALNAVVVWRLLRRLGLPGAWWAAAIFALHPVQVESVAWITERKNVLSGLGFLLAAWSYLRFDERRHDPAAVPAPTWRWYALALGSFAAALLSKTVTCTLPVVLGLMLWWRHRRPSVLVLPRRAPVAGQPHLHLSPLVAESCVAAAVEFSPCHGGRLRRCVDLAPAPRPWTTAGRRGRGHAGRPSQGSREPTRADCRRGPPRRAGDADVAPGTDLSESGGAVAGYASEKSRRLDRPQ